MPNIVSDSESMRVEISDLVRRYPDRFREAGAWLDREYSVAKCLERDLAIHPENYSGELPTLESWQSKILRLRDAVRDLLDDAPYADKANPRVPPSLNPYHYRLLLVEWLCVDPEAFTLKPPLTEFQDLACGELPHDLMHCTTDSFDSEAWRKLCRRSLNVVRRAVDSGDVSVPASDGSQRKRSTPKMPSKKAWQAWRIKTMAGITDQTEIAEKMTASGVPCSQGTVSRHLSQVEEHLAAGGTAPPMPDPMRPAVSTDPAIIDMGARTDHRSRHQRLKQD